MIAALTPATVSALFSSLAAACMAAGAAAAAVAAAPVALVVVGTIVVGVAFVYGVEWLDRKVGHALGEDDTTTWLAKKFRNIAHDLFKVSKDVRYAHYEMMQIVPIIR